ncbi:MAG: hypothetical protein CMP48_20795 [Rickettsiales bacterium]|nr:hypothetical protein [Rickettsiales bacterium]
MKSLQELKSEFSVVEHANLYNANNQSFEFQESTSEELSFLEEMIENQATDSLEYMFLEINDCGFFIMKGRTNYLLVLKLKRMDNFNKPILILKAKATLKSLEQL